MILFFLPYNVSISEEDESAFQYVNLPSFIYAIPDIERGPYSNKD